MYTLLWTFFGALVGGIFSWVISKHYYNKSIEGSKTFNQTVLDRLVRLMEASGVNPDKVTWTEIRRLIEINRETTLSFDHNGEAYWNYCSDCGSTKTIKLKYSKYRDSPGAESVVRIIEGRRRYGTVYFTKKNAYALKCCECGKSESRLNFNARDSLPDSIFTNSSAPNEHPPIVIIGKVVELDDSWQRDFFGGP